jgi:hypothetical protein
LKDGGTNVKVQKIFILKNNMKNIHLLPTSQLSRLVKIYNEADKKLFELKLDIEVNDNFKEYQNIYITSDEEIKEGDWLIVNDEDVMQMKSSYYNDMSGEDIWVGDSLNGYATYKDNCKKIILTTDQDLIVDGVQKIDNEFLEWFVKNPSCERVEVAKFNKLIDNYADKDEDKWEVKYHIYLPKEEPEQESGKINKMKQTAVEQKAKDLFDKFEDKALIVVDEILTALDEHQWQNRNVIEFYFHVKKEIEKL